MFNSIDDAIEALESKQVNGMLLDRYAASYYQRDGKLESLITVKKLDLQRDIGALFHNNRKALAECLTNNFRSDIWRSVQGITDLYKVIFKIKKKRHNFGIKFLDSLCTVHRFLNTASRIK